MDADYFLIDLAEQLQKNTTMFVIEPDLLPFIRAIHLFDLSVFIKRWQVKFIINSNSDSFHTSLNQYYYPLVDVVEIQHPIRYEQNSEYFSAISNTISEISHNRQPKNTTQKQLKFLIFAGTSGVGWPYIMQDVIAALHKLGHKVRLFHLDDSNVTPQLIKELRKHRPDFIIMLDAIGLMPGLFEAEEIPYVSCFSIIHLIG